MPAIDRTLDVLLLTDMALWPLDHGGRVRTVYLARALRDRGLRVGIATMQPFPADGPDDLRLLQIDWPVEEPDDIELLDRGWAGPACAARWRLARYLVDQPRRLAGATRLVRRHRPAAVLGVSLNSAMMLCALHGLRGHSDLPLTRHVWCYADELLSFHLSCLRRESIAQVPARLRKLSEHLALERLFARGLDGAAGASPLDTRFFKLIAGVARAATVPNGVDLVYFTPALPNALLDPLSRAVSVGATREPPTVTTSTPFGCTTDGLPSQVSGRKQHVSSTRSLVFWGRMDFEPNADAVCWFARTVWPSLRHRWPDARWQIVGKSPSPAVWQLAAIPGIEVTGEVPDVRPFARAAAISILPMRCGLGIKNKLLEAVAMARPVIASPRAVSGLNVGPGSPPFLVCRSAVEWIEAVRRVWSDAVMAADLARRGHEWVRARYTWASAAEKLVGWLQTMPGPTIEGGDSTERTTDGSGVSTPTSARRNGLVRRAA